MQTYSQFCPVAKAAEVFGERWTLLVIRQLLTGDRRFNEIQKALPRASPTILTRRLKELEDKGIVSRKDFENHHEYHLTPAGLALQPLLEQMGHWASQWIHKGLMNEDLDAYLLMGDVQRRLILEKFPLASATLQVSFTDLPCRRNWWIVVNKGQVDLCDRDPGSTVNLYLESTLKTFTEIWLGRRSIAGARKQNRLRITGDKKLAQGMEQWIGKSLFA